jgi:hypothetical protein
VSLCIDSTPKEMFDITKYGFNEFASDTSVIYDNLNRASTKCESYFDHGYAGRMTSKSTNIRANALKFCKIVIF